MSVVGIDLGTTNTVVACVRSGKVHVLADEHGQRLLPSVVSFHPNGEVLVGGAARARRVIDPRNTVYSHKRLIGRSWGSPEIVQAKQRFAFELKEGPGQGPLIHARGQDYTLPEISAFVLKRTKQIAEQALGTPVERAVITVPAHFNELQRASTKVAGRVSGLEVLRILNEPTAAALAYGLGRSGNERVAVYDFGGGTFDCTLLDLSGNVFEVLATAGDSFLGGDDVDTLIADRMAESFLKAHRIDPRTDPSMLERLRTSAEEIKMQLSTAETHTVVLKDVAHGMGGSSIHFTFTMTRRDLEALTTPLIDRTFKVTQDALSLARLTPTGFDKVILVGGSTRMPLVRKRVEAFFGTAPLDRVNPDEVVAIGAAIQAAALTEGQKRRSIPAPPPVPGQPRTLPGVQLDADTTQVGSPQSKPGFGGAAPPFGSPPSTKPGPPPAATARTPGERKNTAPGVGGPARPSPGQAESDDPSFASFPDLAVPTPFEWKPGGAPSSDRTQAKPRSPLASEPEGSFGDFGDFGAMNEPPSLVSTPTASLPSFPSFASTPGVPPKAKPSEPEPFGGDFGDLGDLSLASTPSASYDSRAAAVRSPAPSTDAFGQIRDLSIVSTSAETNAIEAITEARQAALAGPFGGGEGEDDGDTAAMTRGPGGTVSLEPGGNPAARGPAKIVAPTDEAADLPAVVPTADLPALSRGKALPTKKAQIGMGPGGGSAMLGKPPPVVAPQPFGPMERALEPAPPSRTLGMPPQPPAAAKPPVPATVRTPGKPAAPNTTSPMPARSPQPSTAGAMPGPMPPRSAPPPNTTAPMQARAPGSPPAPFAATLASPGPLQPPGGSAPPPGYNVTSPMQASPMPPPVAPSAPPPYGPPGYGDPYAPGASGATGAAPAWAAPPPGASGSGPYAAAPGGSGPYGSQPPPHMGGAMGSNPPPIFGAYPSSPPGVSSDVPQAGGGYPSNVPGAPAAPRNIGYAAPVLVDVTPRALVVETAGGYTDTIIPRNAKIPCERTRRFATGRDMQTTVRVRVAQGEHPHFPQNTFLGEVELSGLRPAPRGEVVVAVTFEVDADGTLRIRARDVQTGQEARATLQLIGVADESSVVMMINRFAQQPVTGNGPQGPVS